MKRIVSRLVAGVVVGVAVYVGASRSGPTSARWARRWPPSTGGTRCSPACSRPRTTRSASCAGSTTCARSASRRWGRADSLQVFLAGFALTVTPGKLGEAVKAVLLRASHRIPMAKTAPIVIAERVTDLVALLLLALVGVFSYDVDPRFLIAGAVLVVAGLVVVSVDPVAKAAIAIAGRLPVLRRFAHRFDEAHAHTAILLAPGPLVVATMLATASWFFECLAFWVVVQRLPGRAHRPAGRDVRLRGDDGRGRAVVPARRPRRRRRRACWRCWCGWVGHRDAAPRRRPRSSPGSRRCGSRSRSGLPALLLYARRKHVNIDADVARSEPANGLP